MEDQNIYDTGWYDGIEYALTWKDVNEGILPEDGQIVLIWLNDLILKCTFYSIWYDNYYQKVFITDDGKQFLPGYVQYWIPFPMFPAG